MRITGPLLMLILLGVLAAAPARAQDAEEECPNPQGLWPSPEELQATLWANQEWLDNRGWEDPAVHGRAVLCNADLRDAQLQGADLLAAQLDRAELGNADLSGADLITDMLHLGDLGSHLGNVGVYRPRPFRGLGKWR